MTRSAIRTLMWKKIAYWKNVKENVKNEKVYKKRRKMQLKVKSSTKVKLKKSLLRLYDMKMKYFI